MPLPPVSFPTLGWQVIDWVETFLCHGPGDVQGERWEIDDEIALFICWVYRVHPQGHALAGRRLIHRGVLSRPKGRAKSEIAGGLVCAEALGPVRCDGFDANGDPVGVPVTYPFIRCLATEEDQSGNTYDNVVYMLEEGEAANVYAFDVGRTKETSTRVILREPGGGEIVPSSSGSASKDGGKETFAVADETHLYASRQLRGMYRTVARNTGKRKAAEPWMLDTTTAWEPGERSVAEQAHEKYGHLPLEEAVAKKGVLYDHRQGEEPVRFGDDRSLAKAIRPAYGPAAEWMDFRLIVRIIRDAEDPEAEAYRYYLNRPRKAGDRWLSPDEIQTFLVDDFAPAPGSMIALGFDGSDHDDHTTLMGCTEGGVLFPVGIWAPDVGHEEGWDVPREDVNRAVDWAFETFQVVRMEGDPPWWQEEMGKWAGKHGSPPVVEFWTNVDSKMGAASGALRTGLRNGGAKLSPRELLTDNRPRQSKPLLVWHFENARTRKVRVKLEDRAEEAHVMRKDRPGSALKIDSVPASVLAFNARNTALAKGLFVKQKPYRTAAW